MQQRMQSFRDNLARILQMCREQNVPFILGTVPSNLIKPNLPGDAGARYQQVLEMFKEGKYDEGAKLGREILRNAPRHQSSDTENGIIRNLATLYGAPLADVEAAVIAHEPHHVPGETLFNDHCHLNPAGNTLLIAAYEAQIVRLLGANAK
jgi:hypothetical protein